MLRLAFILIVVLQGLIHLLGFIKAFGFAAINQLTQPISKPKGLLWLLAAVLIETTVVVFILKKDLWWIIGIMSLLISQILIVMGG